MKHSLIMAAAAAIAGSIAGWFACDWKLSGEHAQERLRIERQAARDIAEMQGHVNVLSAALKESNDAASAKLRKAQDETSRLRDRIASDSVRLRVNANCSSASENTADSGPSSVDTGRAAELDPVARSAYFALRDGIDRVTAQLLACQSELRIRAE